ncbi:MAG TPA: glycosyltransferase family 4 protein [Mycobacteriales bacterium]|nr:glycosyltransferase family 4 protein [Mycobacteriales bacterium]
MTAASGAPHRTLVVTNDYPPRPGGIQSFVHELAIRQPVGEIVVYAPAWPGAAAFDAALPYPVVRHPTSLMLPVPDVAHRAARVARAEGCDTAWFGAAAPLGLLAPTLRRHTGIEWTVASTHGHEVGWALLPGTRQLLRGVGAVNDVVTYLGDYTRRRLARALGSHPRLVQVASGVDPAVFRPDSDGAQVRSRHGLTGRPVVVCVSRLVARKGQDALIRALPAIRRRVPDAALLLVGGGPYRSTLERLVREHDVAEHVVLTGSVPQEELAAHYAAGDVFAMPCRSRGGGLEVEGLGIVYLEASATGLPVVAGDSGGAPDAVLPGETGEVVDGRDVAAVAAAVGGLLADPTRSAAWGARGRAWVQERWQWSAIAARFRDVLRGDRS